MKHALENLEASECAQEQKSKAQREVQRKIDEAKAVAKRRETFLLNHSLYGSFNRSRAPMGSTYWESISEEDESGSVRESMDEIVSASMYHMLPAEKRNKEAARLRKENKKLLKGAKNVDFDIENVFEEQHKSSVAGLINDIAMTEEEEQHEKDAKSRKDKCVIS